jgi:D-inositol-3-phosphate glycosyltransferase
MSVYIRELAGELARGNHHVDIFTCNGQGEQAAVIKLADNIRVITVTPFNDNVPTKKNLFPYLPAICRAIEHFATQDTIRYDILHSHYWLSGCAGKLLQKEWHIPNIIMFHTLGHMKQRSLAADNEPTKRIYQEKNLVTECQKIIAPTTQERDNLVHYYNASPDKIAVIPGGINIDLFQINSQEEARTTLGLNRNEHVILYVGRFASLKRIDHLIKAVHILAGKYKIKLLIVGGDGSNDLNQQRLVALVAKYNLERQIHFVGRIKHYNLPVYYNAADLFVLPSFYESFGLVCLESLACGTPVIASNVGVMARVLDGKKNGVALPELNPKKLAAAIERFVCTKRSDSSLQEHARKTILPYSWKHAAGATTDIYKTLIDRN